MKKMTKILSIVLALAMVLSMTAFAGTPSKLLFKDDFSDLDVTTAAGSNKLQNSTNVGSSQFSSGYANTFGAARQAAIDAGTPLTGILNNRFYKSHNAGKFAVHEIDGVKYVQANTSLGWASAHLGYALDNPFTYEDSLNRKVALVYQVGMSFEANASQSYANSQLGKAHFAKTTTETADTYASKSLLGTAAALNAETGAHTFNLSGYGGSAYLSVPANTRVTSEMIFRPYKNVWNEGVIEESDKKLSSLSTFNRLGHASHMDEDIKADEILAISYDNANYESVYYDHMRIYEVSLDGADMYIDTAAMKTTDLELDDKLQVIFSQPISGTPAYTGSYVYYTVEDSTVVTRNGEVLTKDEDYTITVDEEIYDEIGGAVKGSVTVDIIGDMKYDETYEVTFDAQMRNIARVPMSADNTHTATFKTLATPTFDISINAYEGLAAGSAITADAMAGKTVYFTANATNTTGRAIDGVLAIGIYDANGNLVKYAAMNQAFANAGSASYAAAFKMEDGYTAKAFVKGTASTVTFGN